MNTKTLIGGLIGGVVFFLLGWLVWGMLLGSTMQECMSCMRAEEEMNWPLGILANLLYGLFLAWALSKMTGVNSFQSGLQTGALFMGLLALAMDIGFYVYSTMFASWTCVFIDIIINIVMGGIVGGVIGWWFGRKPGPVV